MIPFAPVAETETPEGQEALGNAVDAVRATTEGHAVEIVTVPVAELESAIERYELEDVAEGLMQFARSNPEGVVVFGEEA